MKTSSHSKAFVFFILFFSASCQSVQQHVPHSQKPNVIFINVDDLGYQDVGFMGSQYYETPNIDRLPAEGMVFTRGYAGAANCAPSRACLLSGQNTPRHGIYTVGNSDRGDARTRQLIPVRNTLYLPDTTCTLGDLFKKAGYATGAFGKWHVSEDPSQQGFDVNYGGNQRGNPGKNGYISPYNNLPNLENAPAGEWLTDRLAAEAIRFIKSSRDKPFFLYLTYYAVHTPLMGKEELVAKYEKKAGSGGQENPIYAVMVENVDTNIGLLMKTIDELGLRENTLIVFTLDNGGIRAISSQHPLRAGKGSYYEGGIRVPYIIRWLGLVKANSRSDVPIVNLDFFPTFMDILKVQVSEQVLDGASIVPLLEGKQIANRPLFWHFPIYLEAYSPKEDNGRDPLFRTRPGSVVMLDNWKLHQYFEDGGIELYYLNEDVGERHNLVDSYPEKANELLAVLENWRAKTNAPIPTVKNPQFDTEFHLTDR